VSLIQAGQLVGAVFGYLRHRTMPFRACPNCQAHTARVLQATSTDPIVWYARCHECGHTWTVSKDGREIIREVVGARIDASH